MTRMQRRGRLISTQTKQKKDFFNNTYTEKYDLEEVEQEKVVKFLQFQMSIGKVLEFSAIGNGLYVSGNQIAVKARNGVRGGVPDIIVIYQKNNEIKTLWIEMKTIIGKLSDNQKNWINLLRSSGQPVLICYGFEDFRKKILEYF